MSECSFFWVDSSSDDVFHETDFKMSVLFYSRAEYVHLGRFNDCEQLAPLEPD